MKSFRRIDQDLRNLQHERAPTDGMHVWRNAPLVDDHNAWEFGGSAGTAGQILTSNGAGVEPTWQAAPGIAGLAGNGTTDTLWYINSDATAASEDSELRWGGGTGTNEGRWRAVTIFGSDALDLYYQEDNAGGGTFAMQANSSLWFGYGAGSTTTRATHLRIYSAGGGALANCEISALAAATGGVDVTFSSVSAVWTQTNGSYIFDGRSFTVGATTGLHITSGSSDTWDIQDNNATAWTMQQSTNRYLRMVTTNGTEQVQLGNTALSGLVIALFAPNYVQIDNGTRDARMSINGNALRLNTEVDVAPMVTQMTTAQRTGLTPQNGMIVYDTDLTQIMGYAAGAWGVIL